MMPSRSRLLLLAGTRPEAIQAAAVEAAVCFAPTEGIRSGATPSARRSRRAMVDARRRADVLAGDSFQPFRPIEVPR